MPDLATKMQTATDEQVVLWGKEFRSKLPDSKFKKLFDQFIRSKSDVRSGTPEEKLIPKRVAIQEAVKYYSIKYEIEVPDFRVEERKDEKLTILQVEPVKEMDTFIKKKRQTKETTPTSTTSKRGRKKKEEVVEKIEVKEKKKRTPQKKTEKEVATILPLEAKPPENLVVSYLEENMETLAVEDVEVVPVTIMEYDSRKYYCDERKGKLYEVGKTNKVGNYVGRWNPRTSAIESDIPDSDAEN